MNNNEEKNIIETDVAETPAAEPVIKKQKKTFGKQIKFNKRKLRFGSVSIAITAVFVVSVVLLNVIVGALSAKFPLTLDMSEEKVYTLTADSQAVAKSVTKELNIVVFADEKLFSQSTTGADSYGVPEYDTMLLEFYNVLKQYAVYSNDLVKYQYIDPNQYPAEFSSYQLEFNDLEPADILLYSGSQHRIITVDDMFSVEYTDTSSGTYTFESKVEGVLASAINSLIGGEIHKVLALTGHSENEDLIASLKNLYELNGYEFVEHNLTGSTDFDAEAEIMLIAAPQFDYSATDITRISNWIKNGENYGRHLMVYTHYSADCPNLYKMLEVDYKITVTNQLILETDYERIYSGAYQTNAFYTLADIPQTDFTKNSNSTAQVYAPFSRRIVTTLPDKDEESNYGIYGLNLINFPSSTQVVNIDKLNSDDFNAEKDLQALNEDSYPLTTMVTYVSELTNNTTGQDVRSTVVVCGSPEVGYESNVKLALFKNEDLLLDVANKMINAKETVRIHSKQYTQDSVYFDANTQLILGYGVFIIGVPVIILVICLVVFLRRKNL